MPAFDDEKVIETKFQHIEELFDKERNLPLKKAHKLTQSSLCPNNLERRNVQHAVVVFDESTWSALYYIAQQEKKPKFAETARFVQTISEMWRIINVKQIYKGTHHRDEHEKPIFEADDWQLKKLEKLADWFDEWHKYGKSENIKGLSSETFVASSHLLR